MDDLDKYLKEQMNDPEFMKQWQESQKEFNLEEEEILEKVSKNPNIKGDIDINYLISAV